MEFSRRARWWFAQRGINITAALTDNGSCYRSHLWRDELKTSGLKHRRTRPYRPQTNGKGASSGSTGPCAMSGHTSARTAQRPNGDKHLQTGSTPTTITGATPQSAATHHQRQQPPKASQLAVGFGSGVGRIARRYRTGLIQVLTAEFGVPVRPFGWFAQHQQADRPMRIPGQSLTIAPVGGRPAAATSRDDKTHNEGQGRVRQSTYR